MLAIIAPGRGATSLTMDAYGHVSSALQVIVVKLSSGAGTHAGLNRRPGQTLPE